jgi:hypothetical protein
MPDLVIAHALLSLVAQASILDIGEIITDYFPFVRDWLGFLINTKYLKDMWLKPMCRLLTGKAPPRYD